MNYFGFREILVSDYGLREGILINLQKRLSKIDKPLRDTL